MKKRRFRSEILLVALVTVGPVIGAYLLYYGGDPAGLPRLENPDRDLLDPPVRLPAMPARSGRAASDDVLAGPGWALIYGRTSPCDARCLRDLVRLRQVHLALGRDQDRVRRVYVGRVGETDVGADPDLFVVDVEAPPGRALLEALETIGRAPGPDGRVYVADPHGNLVMSYPPGAEQDGMRDDLKRLLSVSQIG